MKNTAPLRFLNGLKIGLDELQFGQAEQDEAARAWRRATMLTPGLVIARLPDGSLDDNWRLDDDDDDGSLSLRAGASFGAWPQYAALVAEDGALLVIDRDYLEELTLPNDATWHTVTVRQELTLYEEGAIVLTAGSANITGTGTKFTKYAGYTTDGFGRGTRIRIDAADSASGNEGTYELDTVVSDTVATLRAAIPGGSETIARFTIAGDFIGAVPASPDIHYRRRLVLERQTGIVREPAADTIPLYDVKRDDAGAPNVTFIDRRRQRLYRSAVRGGLVDARVAGLTLSWYVEQDSVAIGLATPAVDIDSVANGGTNIVATAVAPSSDHDLLIVVEDNLILRGVTNNHHQSTAIAGTFAGQQPSLTRCPPGSGYTHLLVYSDAGVIYARTTADAGVTWSGAILVWDATALDALDTGTWPCVYMLQNNRIMLAIEWFDNSAALSKIVAVTSDDYGATWDTNAGAGYLMFNVAGSNCGRPALAQGVDGWIWCAHTIGSSIGISYSTDLEGQWGGGAVTVTDVVIETFLLVTGHNSPVLWMSPDGQPVIVYHAYQAVAQYSAVYYAVIGWQPSAPYLMMQARLLGLDSGLVAIQDLGLSMCQEASGLLALVFVDTQSSPTDAHVTRLVPLSMPKQTAPNQGYLRA